VLYPLLVRARLTGNEPPTWLLDRLMATLPHYDMPDVQFVANGFPQRANATFMDTWYFLENALIKLAWVAHLTDSQPLRAMFGRALAGARTLAHNCAYQFPLFADAADWQARGSLLNVGVGGLYAAGCVLGWQMFGERAWLEEAAQALRTLYALPPHLLTHEPQQLSFGAAAAQYLARLGEDAPGGEDWSQVAADLVRLSLRMGYWGQDAAVPMYDARGMFQACASLCYPAYKENVEVLLAWPELLRDDAALTPWPPLPHGEGESDQATRSGFTPELTRLMAAFANLGRCHNTSFFDDYLPEDVRRGPCPAIPYEDVATAEFLYTATLGKELYGAGEVLWSALMFDALGQVDAANADVLCLSLDVPTLDLNASAVPHAALNFLVYNPSDTRRRVTVTTPLGERVVEVDANAYIRLTVTHA
jgi:hypothetical protein